MRKNKILFASSAIGDPIYSKRISMIIRGGYNVVAITFDRGEHKSRIPECDTYVLGKIIDGNYVKRMIKFYSAFKIIRKNIRSNDLVYAAGVDMAFISLIASIGINKPVILEVSDIRELQTSKKYKGRIYRYIDKFIANNCVLIVATAQGFIDEYYKKWLKTKTDGFIIENKLEKEKQYFLPDKYKINNNILLYQERKNKKIRIGYFGIIRCRKSLDILYQLAKKNADKFEIIIAGELVKTIDEENGFKDVENVIYLGKYNSPQDLAYIYGMIDIVWACYPFPDKDSWNWKWARTNRFYESCFYKKPIIALKGSGDANFVDLNNIGILIENATEELIIEKVSKISFSDIRFWEKKLENIPESVYVYTNETYELEKRIRRIFERI